MKEFMTTGTVKAALIVKVNRQELQPNPQVWGYAVVLDDASDRCMTAEWVAKHARGGPDDLAGGYFVEYPDGYTSWCPKEAFEARHLHVPAAAVGAGDRLAPLPVAGYKAQSAENVQLVNGFKADEERILRKLDQLSQLGHFHEGPGPAPVDLRWLQIGRTDLERAFMAINRAVFQPGRVELPEDAASVREQLNAAGYGGDATALHHATSAEEELRQADAYMSWQMNPCGKPPLDLSKLERVEKWTERCPSKGVDFTADPGEETRGAALNVLQMALHQDRSFPANLVAYYEGTRPGLPGCPDTWVIEVYGEGAPAPVLPEPPRPAWMGDKPMTVHTSNGLTGGQGFAEGAVDALTAHRPGGKPQSHA